MRKLIYIAAIFLLILVAAIMFIFSGNRKKASGIEIIHPFADALFPPEFPAPYFKWWSEGGKPPAYEVSLFTSNKKHAIHATTDQTEWMPDEAAWDSIKVLSDFRNIYLTVKKKGDKKAARINFRLSRDSVAAPVLYREMPIPFLIAEKMLDSMNFMLINFGSRRKPHTAMRGFPVCGNCHSFTADGKSMGLDLDAGLRDKGGYFVSRVEDTLRFELANYTSWSRLEKRRTFGLFSKLSPDGRYIVTTVKDRVVIKNFPVLPVENVTYSQLFFPVNGHLAIYDRNTGSLRELPGANLDEYVQSNAVWTPDGKNIIFSRAEALPMGDDIYEIDVKDEKIVNEYVERKRSLKYDLYVIPFNDGNGGKAEPIEGASNNGKSNYFPAISPDGKWLIYCQAENFMLLMPDSRLYIVPVAGGKARRLECNFNSMNSWHSWSPNSKWIVYASKIFGPYTDMFLSHIDDKGNASIPVLVDKVRVPARVINYPEFLNRKPEDTFVMNYDFVELAHINRAIRSGDIGKARELYFKLEKQDLFFFKEDCEDMSFMLNKLGLPEEAKKYDELAKHTINTSVFSH
ncbi:MAG: PD40 domain-containing protein [Cyclobacteriaceae bacterium]|nr:PD40 domain-containing protein [Cyclobacteriaceae bacterium]